MHTAPAQTRPRSRTSLNVFLSVVGIFGLGVLAMWYPMVILKVPMPASMPARVTVIAIWQVAVTAVLPYAWAAWRLGLRPADLGLSRVNLGRSIWLGCALYALALAAFLHCSNTPLLQNDTIRTLSPLAAVWVTGMNSVIAAGTDITTRGFVLLTLKRYTGVRFAVLMQNVGWFAGHLFEISLLASCLGLGWAIALTLTLGILGDLIVLRTRNVVGLAIAHVLLNVILNLYIRSL